MQLHIVPSDSVPFGAASVSDVTLLDTVNQSILKSYYSTVFIRINVLVLLDSFDIIVSLSYGELRSIYKV